MAVRLLWINAPVEGAIAWLAILDSSLPRRVCQMAGCVKCGALSSKSAACVVVDRSIRCAMPLCYDAGLEKLKFIPENEELTVPDGQIKRAKRNTQF